MVVQLQYIQWSMDETNAADLSSGVFAILIKDDNNTKSTLPFDKFHQKLVSNTDVTKEALKCPASL